MKKRAIDFITNNKIEIQSKNRAKENNNDQVMTIILGIIVNEKNEKTKWKRRRKKIVYIYTCTYLSIVVNE